MPKRPPTLAERLRTVWSPASTEVVRDLPGEVTPGSRERPRGADFADRLRAAVTQRH